MARLPIPGSDKDTWGTILNDYLSQSLASDGLLKPGSVSNQQIADGSLTQAKVQNLQADLGVKIDTSEKEAANGVATLDSSTKVPIVQLPTGTSSTQVALGNHSHTTSSIARPVYPLSAIGAFTASAEMDDIGAESSFGAAFFARIFIPANQAINAVGMYITTAGTLGAGGENSFAVYDDSGTFVASTPSDNNLWTATGWRSEAFSSPIAAQGVDRFVYVSPLVNGYSSGVNTLYFTTRTQVTEGMVGFTNKRRSFFQSTLAAWPASFDPATYGGNGGGFIPFIALA